MIANGTNAVLGIGRPGWAVKEDQAMCSSRLSLGTLEHFVSAKFFEN